MEKGIFENIKKEMVNRAYMDDFLASNGSIIPDLSGYAYEHKYYLTTLARIKKLLENKQQHIKGMQKLLTDCKIDNAILEYIDPREQNSSLVAMTYKDLCKRDIQEST